MNRPTPLSDRPEVQRHLYRDNDVTRDRLDAFVTDDDATRLRVLAELRTRSVDQETTLTLTLQAAGISTVAVDEQRRAAEHDCQARERDRTRGDNRER
jgi:hypothetical protein